MIVSISAQQSSVLHSTFLKKSVSGWALVSAYPETRIFSGRARKHHEEGPSLLVVNTRLFHEPRQRFALLMKNCCKRFFERLSTELTQLYRKKGVSGWALLSFLIAGISMSTSAESNWQVDAEWSIDAHRANADATQAWVPSQDAQASYDLNIAAEIEELKFELSWTDEIKLEQLSVEHYQWGIDWTLGQQTQQWAYTHQSSVLNWLQPAPLFMAEYFGFYSQWQALCQQQQEVICGLRYSGWQSIFDAQLMLAYQQGWQIGFGGQAQIGQGGLLFSEWEWKEAGDYWSLATLPTGDVSAEVKKGERLRGNAGLQWSFSSWMTYAQIDWNSKGLQPQQGDQVITQLNRQQAYLVSPIFDELGKETKYSLYAEKQWGDLSTSVTWVQWPSLQATWLSQINLTGQLSSRVSWAVDWLHHNPEGVLGMIGNGDQVSISLRFVDGA